MFGYLDLDINKDDGICVILKLYTCTTNWSTCSRFFFLQKKQLIFFHIIHNTSQVSDIPTRGM